MEVGPVRKGSVCSRCSGSPAAEADHGYIEKAISENFLTSELSGNRRVCPTLGHIQRQGGVQPRLATTRQICGFTSGLPVAIARF